MTESAGRRVGQLTSIIGAREWENAVTATKRGPALSLACLPGLRRWGLKRAVYKDPGTSGDRWTGTFICSVVCVV